MSGKRIQAAFLGTTLLIWGAFLPIVTHQLTGDVNLHTFDGTYSTLLLVTVGAVLAILMSGKLDLLWGPFGASVTLILLAYWKFQSLSDVSQLVGKDHSPSREVFADAYIFVAKSASIVPTGWIILLAGATALGYAAASKSSNDAG